MRRDRQRERLLLLVWFLLLSLPEILVSLSKGFLGLREGGGVMALTLASLLVDLGRRCRPRASLRPPPFRHPGPNP